MSRFRRKQHPDCQATVQDPTHDGDGYVVMYPGCDRPEPYEGTAYGSEVTAEDAKAHAQQRVVRHKTKGIRGW
ncbi:MULTISPECIES: hypothetical protein [unclassified Nonomuraea]|uniref:hypothetical protein n=1 Tax=unclassified Nonomuraea TaxID=2593643 RepID=UPI0033CCFB54